MPRSFGPSGRAITPPGPSPRPAACATAAAVATAAGSVAISTGCAAALSAEEISLASMRAGRDEVEVAAAAAGEQQPRSTPHGLSHAQLEHARGVADLALARDDDQVGPVELGDRHGVGRELLPRPCPWEPAADERAATGGAHELGPGVRLLVGLLARCDHRDGIRAVQRGVMAQAPRDRLGDLLRARRLEPARPAHETLEVAVGGAQVDVGEAALVAQPALVHTGVVARDHALNRALAHAGPRVAAGRAERAHAGDVRDLPGSRPEAILGRRQRTDGAQLDHVARETTAVGLLLERRDDRGRAALARDQLLVLGDVLREARAAIAEDAALSVEGDQRRDRERLLVRALVEVEARVARPVAVRQVLQRDTRRPCRRLGNRADG